MQPTTTSYRKLPPEPDDVVWTARCELVLGLHPGCLSHRDDSPRSAIDRSRPEPRAWWKSADRWSESKRARDSSSASFWTTCRAPARSRAAAAAWFPPHVSTTHLSPVCISPCAYCRRDKHTRAAKGDLPACAPGRERRAALHICGGLLLVRESTAGHPCDSEPADGCDPTRP